MYTDMLQGAVKGKCRKFHFFLEAWVQKSLSVLLSDIGGHTSYVSLLMCGTYH